MTVYAFAKDSRACAACVSWGGERGMAPDNTLVHVVRYSVEGDCRTAISQDYRKVTKAYHTCAAWSPLPMLRAHGGRSERSPGPSAALSALIAGGGAAPPPAAKPPLAAKPLPTVPAAPPPEPMPAPEPERCHSTPLDIDKVPQQARVLYGYWQRLKLKRKALPLAVELDTAQIRECVSRLCLLSPAGDAGDFIYRSCGRMVQRRLGFRPVGKRVSACHPSHVVERSLSDLRNCLAQRDAMSFLVSGDPLLPGARSVELLLPLADENGQPAFVLAYRHLPGA